RQAAGPPQGAPRSHRHRVVPADGVHALSAGGDALILWDVDGGKEARRVPANAGGGRAAFSADGKRAAAWCADKALRAWDVATGAELWKKAVPLAWALVALSPDGRTLAVSADQPKPLLFLLDAQTGEELGRFEGADWPVGRLLS